MKKTILLLLMIHATAWANTLPHATCELEVHPSVTLSRTEEKIMKKKGYQIVPGSSMHLARDMRFDGGNSDYLRGGLVLSGTNQSPSYATDTPIFSFTRPLKTQKDEIKSLPICIKVTSEYLSQPCPDISGTFRVSKVGSDSGVDGIGIYQQSVNFRQGAIVEIDQPHCKVLELKVQGSDGRRSELNLSMSAMQRTTLPHGGATIFESDENRIILGYTADPSNFYCEVVYGIPMCGRSSKYSDLQTLELTPLGIKVTTVFKDEGKTYKHQTVLTRISDKD